MNALLKEGQTIAGTSDGVTKESPAMQSLFENGQVIVLVVSGGKCCMPDFNGISANAILSNLSGSLALNNPMAGTVENTIESFISSLKKDKKASKTIKGYTADTIAVMNVIASEYFHGNELNEINLLQITEEQILAAEYHLFHESKKRKPKSLNRLKQGWNRFCKFIGKENWKFTTGINATQQYKSEAISNADVIKMIGFCQQQAAASSTITERTRWLRIEIMLGLGWAGGFRSCEYTNAKFDEIKNAGVITIVNSKQNGTREVPITSEVQKVAEELKKILLEAGLYSLMHELSKS